MLTPHLFPLVVNGGSGGTDKRERGWGRFKKCNRGHGTGSGLLTTRERREGSRHLPCCVPTAPGAPSFSCHRSDLVGGRRPPAAERTAPPLVGLLPPLPPSVPVTGRCGSGSSNLVLLSPPRCAAGRVALLLPEPGDGGPAAGCALTRGETCEHTVLS